MMHASGAVLSGRTQAHAAARPAARICALTVAGLLLLGLAPPSHAAAVTTAERRTAVLYYTNQVREAHGCGPLAMNSRLTTASQRHANDMAAKDYFGHTSLSGRSWDDRIRAAGYGEPGGENIAYGFKTGKEVVRAWMKSPAHRRNILTCAFKKMGVGHVKQDGIFVQDFGY